MAQFFVGKDTLVCDGYEIKSQKQFINTLYDNIKTRGAMDTIITDGGKYEISKKVADLLRSLFIKQYESEPYHQHQNKAEQCYGVVKKYINTLMNLTGAPAHCWLLCLGLYLCPSECHSFTHSQWNHTHPSPYWRSSSVIFYISLSGSLFTTR